MTEQSYPLEYRVDVKCSVCGSITQVWKVVQAPDMFRVECRKCQSFLQVRGDSQIFHDARKRTKK